MKTNSASFDKIHLYTSYPTFIHNTTYINLNVRNRVSINNTYNLRTIFGRPIIDYVIFGQQSDYQCESLSEGVDYWFYSYNTSIVNSWVYDTIDNSTFGSNQKVKYCMQTRTIWEIMRDIL